jgi:hypothetical protein
VETRLGGWLGRITTDEEDRLYIPDTHNNVVRVAYQAMAAVLGGTAVLLVANLTGLLEGDRTTVYVPTVAEGAAALVLVLVSRPLAAFLTPHAIHRQYSIFPDGSTYFCMAKVVAEPTFGTR